MKIDLYHLHRGLHFTRLAYPIVLDVLRTWAEASGWEARVSICRESAVDLDTDADVVGISVYTQTAPAAYRAAAALRRRGKVVFFGGPHFRGDSTVAEAEPFCDVVAGSIDEATFRGLLADVAAGRLAAGGATRLVRDAANRFRYPHDFHQAIRSRRWYQIPTIPTSLGCPYDCNFCAAYLQGKYLLRDITSVRNEVAHAPGRVVLFSDATFGLHKRWTIALMDAIAPLRKKIAIETTLARVRDPELLRAMARGGVRWVVVGVETFGERLRKHGGADVDRSLIDVVAHAHELGMVVQGNFICGLDSDGPGSFDEIYEHYDRSGLDAIMIGILTPYPNTGVFRDLQAAGRIIDGDWEHYDCHHVVYRPLRMTVDQLVDGYVGLYRALRRRKSVLRENLERGRQPRRTRRIAPDDRQQSLPEVRLDREDAQPAPEPARSGGGRDAPTGPRGACRGAARMTHAGASSNARDSRWSVVSRPSSKRASTPARRSAAAPPLAARRSSRTSAAAARSS